MSRFALSLPTDIPWRRICVSEDMLDPRPCDSKIPPRWRTSIAVFRYDPTEEYQPHEDFFVSYLKVAVTIAPFAPEIDNESAKGYITPRLIDEIEEAFPCYGALLHVSVAPSKKDGDVPLAQYPYFSDFEPKKRELYELVTDTGEVLSGSSTKVGVGKSSTTTETTENYNLDTGWNFGTQGSYAGTGGGGSVGSTGQHGVVNRAGLENNNIRTADASTERRELQSHITQLSQMYNLFQAFHLGTNRALFLMEPRPHIRQAEVTFVNGPRALEGLQEIFLTVGRPKEMSDFCASVLLETAHLTKEPVYDFEEREDMFDDFRLLVKAENRDTDSGQTDFTSEPIRLTKTYYAPPGWIIVGYETTVLNAKRIDTGPTVEYSSTLLTISGSVTWRFWEGGHDAGRVAYTDNYEEGQLDVNVKVKLRKEQPKVKEYVRKIFLGSRGLCCCQTDTGFSKMPVSITYVADMPRTEISKGMTTSDTLVQSRLLASAIRSEMIQSINSSRRVEVGTRSYMESDAFYTRVADVLQSRRMTREMFKPLSNSKIAPSSAKESLGKNAEEVSLGRFLQTDAVKLAATAGISHEEALKLKDMTLRAIGQELRKHIHTKPTPNTPATPTTPDPLDPPTTRLNKGYCE